MDSEWNDVMWMMIACLLAEKNGRLKRVEVVSSKIV